MVVVPSCCQNVTEVMLAARLLDGGVNAVIHNRVLPFPSVKMIARRGP